MLPEADALAPQATHPAGTAPAPSSHETERPILGVARRTRHEVGANRKGSPAGATWSFLLPGLPLGRAAILGNPSRAARERLAELADEVLDSLSSEGGLDLIWIAPSGDRPVPDRTMLHSRLADGGLIVDEQPGPGAAGEPGATYGLDAVRFRVLRRGGDTVVAIPAGHPATETWLRRHGLAGSRNGIRDRLGRLAAALRGRPRGEPAAWGSLDLVGPAGLDRPARYLIDLAASDGVGIDDHAMALSATGPYRTQKVLVPLFPPGASAPDIVVKLTRDPSVNPRLQVELDGLRWLATLGPTIAERVPAVRFAGMHAGMLVVGESALEGEPYRAPRAKAHPLAVDAVEWLIGLGARTGEPTDTSEVAAALDDLVEAYLAADGPGRTLAAPLRAQVERIRSSSTPFPVVAQHGDPGTWNLVAMAGNRTGFLDWENLERRGMPLWDLFYLLRSLGVGSRGRRPLERRLGHVQRTLLDDSEMTPFIVEAVRRYCAQVGVADDLVEPLYHLGWMYQALKEVTRLQPGHLGEGHFYALLRRGFERRDRGTLQLLFRGNHR